MFGLRIFRAEFQCIFKGHETKAGIVEIIIFTSSVYDLVCPAKYLTYCSQVQTEHAGGRGFLVIWNNASVFVILQYLILPHFTLALWGKKNHKVIIKKVPLPLFSSLLRSG